MNEDLIKEIANSIRDVSLGKVSLDDAVLYARQAVATLEENSLISYTYDDPDGINPSFQNTEELFQDMELWDEGLPMPVFVQFEPRDPAFFIKFIDGKSYVQ